MRGRYDLDSTGLTRVYVHSLLQTKDCQLCACCSLPMAGIKLLSPPAVSESCLLALLSRLQAADQHEKLLCNTRSMWVLQSQAQLLQKSHVASAELLLCSSACSASCSLASKQSTTAASGPDIVIRILKPASLEIHKGLLNLSLKRKSASDLRTVSKDYASIALLWDSCRGPMHCRSMTQCCAK